MRGRAGRGEEKQRKEWGGRDGEGEARGIGESLYGDGGELSDT